MIIKMREQILKVNVTKLSEPIYVEERKCNMIGYWGYRMNDNAYVIGEIKESDFVKCSDSIEDLFDEFVCENKIIKGVVEKRTKDGKIKKTKTKIEVAKILAKKHKVYGAIWTDKGLIYVAKMNEKGDLELL